MRCLSCVNLVLNLNGYELFKNLLAYLLFCYACVLISVCDECFDTRTDGAVDGCYSVLF